MRAAGGWALPGGSFFRLEDDIVKHLVSPALLLGISSVVHAATVTAKVVALGQVLMYNRLGSQQPGGMIYALARDVVSKTNLNRTCDTLACNPGQVQLRPGKWPGRWC